MASKPKPLQQENLRLTMNETIPYLPGLSPVAGKELHARFDGGRLSTDGGVLLLREIENGLGLADVLLNNCPIFGTTSHVPVMLSYGNTAPVAARLLAEGFVVVM